MGETSTNNGGGDSTMKSSLNIPHTASTIIDNDKNNNGSGPPPLSNPSLVEQDDRFNYALLLALYTLQGIPMVRVEIYWKTFEHEEYHEAL